MEVVKIDNHIGLVLYEAEQKMWYNKFLTPDGLYKTTNTVLLDNGKLKACFSSDMEVIDLIDDKILQ